MRGISVNKFIDIDEKSFYLKSVAIKYGRSHTTYRVRYPVHYTRGAQKTNVLFAVAPGHNLLSDNIDCSVANPRRWLFITDNNCNQYILGDFVESILSHIEQHPAPMNQDEE